MQQHHIGLYQKFHVSRKDGRDQAAGDRHGARYFVLDTTFDPYAPAALLAYADACTMKYPQLAQDLINRAFSPGYHSRDEQGFWSHPANPITDDETSNLVPWLTKYGLESTVIWMHRDASEDDMDIYDATGSCKHWQPNSPRAAPDAPDWQLFYLTDTEDGPAAVFILRLP